MKKLSIAVLSIILLLVIAFTTLASPSTLPDDVLSRLQITYDKFKDSYSVKPSYDYLEMLIDGPQVKLMAFHDLAGKRLVMHVNYTGKDWIFFDYCIFLVGDKRYTTPTYSAVSDSVYRNTLSSINRVSESIYMSTDSPVIAEIIEAIRLNGDSTNVEYRLYGSKGSVSGKMGVRDIQSWHDMCDYYNAVEISKQ